MKTDGAQKMRAIAEEACALVKQLQGRGVLGRARRRPGALGVDRAHHRRAPRRARSAEIKDLFDPKGLMNPGKIVRPLEAGRPQPVPLQARLRRAAARHRARLERVERARARRAPGSPRRSRCATTTATAASSTPAPCARRTAPPATSSTSRAAARIRCASRSPGSSGADALHLGRDVRGAGSVRALQGLQARMPDRRRHGEDENRVPASLSRAPRLLAEGQADRLPAALRALGGALRAAAPICAMRSRPGAEQALARAVAPQALAAASGAATRSCRLAAPLGASAGKRAARSCCSSTPSTTTSSPRMRARRCACSTRRATRVHIARAATARARCAAAAPSSPRAWSTRRGRGAAHARRARALRRARRARRRAGAFLPARRCATSSSRCCRARKPTRSRRRRCCSRSSSRASTTPGRLTLTLKPLPEKRALLHGHCHQKAFGAMSAVEQVLALVPG